MMMDHPTPTINPSQTMDILMRSSMDQGAIWEENHRLLRGGTGPRELLLLGLEGRFEASFLLSYPHLPGPTPDEGSSRDIDIIFF
jgi:hypothetical protein